MAPYFPEGLLGPNGNVLETPLAQCFKVYDMSGIRNATNRTWNSSSYQRHEFKLIAVSSKGAGGTGKTTCAWSIAHSLALAGESVLLLNADGQPSAEERALGKVLNESFDGDIDKFYQANGLQDKTLCTGLRSMKTMPDFGSTFFTNTFPDVVGIDVTKLSGLAQLPVQHVSGEGKVFLMRSDENISEWESELGLNVKLLRATGWNQEFARTYGALYHLSQMMAYMLQAPWVIVDTGPGSGPLLMNVIMSSHGFLVPCGIDQKAKSLMQSLAAKVEAWTDLDDDDSHYGIRRTVNNTKKGPNQFPLPMHTPKFLGVVYSRLGLRGRQFPYNQYAAMVDANTLLQNVFLPTLLPRGFLLPREVYMTAAEGIPMEFQEFNENLQAPQVIRVPDPVAGITGIWIEFGQLQYMSERESVPVFFLEQNTIHLRKPIKARLNEYINAVQEARDPGFSVYEASVYEACSSAERARMGSKIDHLRGILERVLLVLRSDLSVAGTEADWLVVDDDAMASDDGEMHD